MIVKIYTQVRVEARQTRKKKRKKKKSSNGTTTTANSRAHTVGEEAADWEGILDECLEEILSGLRTGGGEEKNEKEECAICLTELEEEEEEKQDGSFPSASSLACVHKFHASCLRLWFQKCTDKEYPLTCPCCRKEI